MRFNDLTGQRFGHLTALEISDWYHYGPKRDKRRAVYRCRCDCGNETHVISSNLVSGNTRSCGCLHRRPKRRKNRPWE